MVLQTAYKQNILSILIILANDYERLMSLLKEEAK